jgi:hypothetical protein
MLKSFQSSLVVSWQRIYNSLTVTTSHTLSLLFTGYSEVSTELSVAISSQLPSAVASRESLKYYSLSWSGILGADPTENTVSIFIAQRLLWLSYTGFQASCHNMDLMLLEAIPAIRFRTSCNQ